jgi:hypothetical protein
MRWTLSRSLITTLSVLIPALILWLLLDVPTSSVSLAQIARVDPVQALIARQAQERLATLNVGPETTLNESSVAAAVQADKFVRVTNETETMTIDVPSDWTDIDTGPWIYHGENVGFFIAAAPDLKNFDTDLSADGIFFGVSTILLQRHQEQGILTLEDALVQTKNKECRKQLEVVYTDQFYQGKYLPYHNCRKQAGHFYFAHVTTPPTGQYAIVLRVNFSNGHRPKVLERIFSSYQVLGKPGIDEHHEHGDQ